MSLKPIENDGYQKLWEFFGLSYASFLVLPRVLLHEMPDEWQSKFADLLNEIETEFPDFPAYEYRVQRVEKNKLSKFPRWLLNYRRPDNERLNGFKRKEEKKG